MKQIIRRAMLAMALLVMTAVTDMAQNSAEVEKTISQIVSKYEGTQGVECATVTKGSGLNIFKMMMTRQLGKDFMKGVRSITIISYSEASEDICQSIRNELNAFVPLLDEFEFGEEVQLEENEYIRCFASAEDDKTVSDFVIAMENDDAKMIMYMAGSIKIE